MSASDEEQVTPPESPLNSELDSIAATANSTSSSSFHSNEDDIQSDRSPTPNQTYTHTRQQTRPARNSVILPTAAILGSDAPIQDFTQVLENIDIVDLGPRAPVQNLSSALDTINSEQLSQNLTNFRPRRQVPRLDYKYLNSKGRQ